VGAGIRRDRLIRGVTERVYAPLAPGNVRGYAESTEAARVLSFSKRKKKAAKK
jgi:hypothetical protein